MKKILMSVLASTVAASAFADFIGDVTSDIKTRGVAVSAKGNEIRSFNNKLVLNAYSDYNANKAQALMQEAAYLTWWKNNVLPNATKMQNALKAGDFATAATLSDTYQAQRREMFANEKLKYGADAFLLVDAKALAKANNALTKNPKVDTKDKAAVANYYSTVQYYAYVTPATIMSIYEFTAQDLPKHINNGVNNGIASITQAGCEASVNNAQAKFATLATTNSSYVVLQTIAAPKSIFRNVLSVAGNQGKYVGDALDVFYAYTTGKVVTGKDTAFNVCDYNAFKANKTGNMYATLMNNNINTVVSKTGNKISAEKAYWALTGASATALTQSVLADKVSGATTPFVK